MLTHARRFAGRVRALPRHRFYDRMEKAGLSPYVCISNSPITKVEARYRLEHGQLLVPNVSGFYHGILKGWWEQYGLGERCLLISETKAVAELFHKTYPGTDFITTDYFVDLQPHPTCDVVWDLCSDQVPPEVSGVRSIICQATLEHIQDPVQVMKNLATALDTGGMLYVQTHTPAYHYHGYPRDYLRYFPDWFVDIADTLGTLELVELMTIDGHVFAAYRKS